MKKFLTRALLLALSLTREAPAQDWITKEWDINGEKATIAIRK